MQTEECRKAIEAILLVSDMPVEASLLAQLLEIPKTEVEKICKELSESYKNAVSYTHLTLPTIYSV